VPLAKMLVARFYKEIKTSILVNSANIVFEKLDILLNKYVSAEYINKLQIVQHNQDEILNTLENLLINLL
jgi:hypothetical protein